MKIFATNPEFLCHYLFYVVEEKEKKRKVHLKSVNKNVFSFTWFFPNNKINKMKCVTFISISHLDIEVILI
jgi:hypothetical protein